MTDPYLMRMIASAYRKSKIPNGLQDYESLVNKKGEMPKSIQINKLFEIYHNELLDKLNSSNLELFLEEIIMKQLKDFFSGSNSLSNIIDSVSLSRN
jgi:hypothetical protein